MPPISMMIKPASGSCNMQCKYCFYRDEQEKRSKGSYGIMSEITLKNCIRKAVLRAEESCSILFQGGEPSLAGLDFFKKAVEYARQYNKNNIDVFFSFQTNGTNITGEWCEFFHDNDFLVGISVDGTKEIHDKYRSFKSGEPTHDVILKACRLLDRYEVNYNILTVVHREVAEHAREIYEFYRKKGWVFQQYITCLDPLFEEKGKEEYSLTPLAYGKFLTELFECWYEDYLKEREPFNRRFENYLGILSGFKPESCEQQGVCGVQYVVEADGSVYPCDFYMLDEYCLGNINKNTFAQIDEKRREIGFREESEKISEECKSCSYYRLCRGGCQRSRVPIRAAFGEPQRYVNYFCEGYKLFFQGCLSRLEKIAREEAL